MQSHREQAGLLRGPESPSHTGLVQAPVSASSSKRVGNVYPISPKHGFMIR